MRHWSTPKKEGYVCHQAPDERFSSWDRFPVTRFPVSVLCPGLCQATRRRTGIVMQHHQDGSNEVELT